MLGWIPRAAPAGAPPVEEIAAAAPPGLAVARGGDLGMPVPLDLEALRARNRAQAVAIAHRNRGAAGG